MRSQIEDLEDALEAAKKDKKRLQGKLETSLEERPLISSAEAGLISAAVDAGF